MAHPFETGKQPCKDFKPQNDGFGTNRHSCYKCDKTVSFCENCNRDHHEDGYETCNIGKELFEMVYQWGRVGVNVDFRSEEYQKQIKRLFNWLNEKESEV